MEERENKNKVLYATLHFYNCTNRNVPYFFRYNSVYVDTFFGGLLMSRCHVNNSSRLHPWGINSGTLALFLAVSFLTDTLTAHSLELSRPALANSASTSAAGLGQTK